MTVDQSPPPTPAEPPNAPAPPASSALAIAPQDEDATEEPSHRLAYTLIAVFLLALAFGAWGAWKVFAPAPQDARSRLRAQAQQIAVLQQQVATLTRSDQISRDANRDLQSTLSERDEEIAGLRADVAFYERFVGATGQRHGLAVHALSVQAQDPQAWHFTATLTQNLNRGAINAGKLTMALEGSRNGRLQQLDWNALRQQTGAPSVPYSFKYFQQVEGDILLPPGFKPVRLIVKLAPQDGAAVEQSFTWADATRAPGADGPA